MNRVVQRCAGKEKKPARKLFKLLLSVSNFIFRWHGVLFQFRFVSFDLWKCVCFAFFPHRHRHYLVFVLRIEYLYEIILWCHKGIFDRQRLWLGTFNYIEMLRLNLIPQNRHWSNKCAAEMMSNRMGIPCTETSLVAVAWDALSGKERMQTTRYGEWRKSWTHTKHKHHRGSNRLIE